MNFKSSPRLTKKGTPYRRIIRSFKKDGHEYSYHATKGWRRRKA